MAQNTLAPPPDKPGPRIKIFVNGRGLPARRGVSVMAALQAAGYDIGHLGHGPESPRQIFCGMGTCYECRVTINGLPDRRACMTATEENMEIVFDR